MGTTCVRTFAFLVHEVLIGRQNVEGTQKHTFHEKTALYAVQNTVQGLRGLHRNAHTGPGMQKPHMQTLKPMHWSSNDRNGDYLCSREHPCCSIVTLSRGRSDAGKMPPGIAARTELAMSIASSTVRLPWSRVVMCVSLNRLGRNSCAHLAN